jgi:adenylosuccinate synthase
MQHFLSELGSMTAVIGAQWGDEGKGKLTDILGEHFDVIARACGGANAGHTIIVNGQKHVFRLLPSGCLHEGKPVVLGAGMVIHLPTLLEEIDLLSAAGIDLVPRLFISHAAHLVFDIHKEIDGLLEERRTEKIGTTKRGIGPAYMEKAARSGLRMESLLQDNFLDLASTHIETLKKEWSIALDTSKEIQSLSRAQELLKDHIILSLPSLFERYRKEGKKILIEGAQATLLDIDHGTYPFVTSSSTTAAGALQGLGLAPRYLTSCIGVAKAYCTRVGEGNFPAEILGERGDALRERGGEYGSVTKRPRRCGWFSVPDVKFSALINGYTCINLTKLDVLDAEDSIPVLIKMDGDTPVYHEQKGWKTSTLGIQNFDDLPEKAQNYILFLEEQIDIPVRIIGTGAKREEMIVREVKND